MSKVMKKMGRTLGNSNFSKMLSESEGARIFVLHSGAEARFVLTKILHADIEEKTYVDPTVNGRDQSLLTPEAVSDIARTIKLQQFFPAIGREIGGRIEVLDGSRRRAACLYNGMPFEILVTRDNLELADARQLAIDIQTAREHTLRELGKRLEVMYPGDMTQSDIARAEGLSTAKITRAFQAAAVPDEMISLFPALNELAIRDYQLLLEINEKITAQGGSLNDVVSAVKKRIEKSEILHEGSVVDKARIMGFFRAECNSLKVREITKKISTERLCDFTDKKQFARKKTDPDKRLVTYEFSRLPATLQAELDAAIREVMRKAAK